MKTRFAVITTLIATVALLPTSAGAQTFAPPQVEPSDLTIQVEHVGTSPATVAQNTQISFGFNLGSPVAIKDNLFLIDQNDAIYRQTSKGDIQKVFDATTEAPDGLALDNRQRVLNIAPGPAKDRMYVVLTSGTEPTNVPVYRMPPPLPDVCCVPGAPIPVDDLYRLGPLPVWLGVVFGTTRTEYQVVYDFKVKGNKLNDPRALVAFETQSGPTHNGGGAVTLPDGRLALALGDGLPFGAEGRDAAQDPASHLSSILLVSPDGSIEVAAKGVRNVQHMEISPDGTTVLFGDIGGVTAEEVNVVGVAELTDTSEIENFGWGRNPDGLAREGTFYVGPGLPLVPGVEPPAVGVAPSPEPGFVQPLAQYGRNDPNGGVAVTGPVTSDEFDDIAVLFSDLASGIPYATTESSGIDVSVKKVNLLAEDGTPLASFNDLVGGRADARFFRFPDGGPGVLLETTGDFYRISEV